jgi:uncharacterized protein involved in exopolysaccharide biosynthesis
MENTEYKNLLFDFLLILLKWKKLLIINFLIVFIISAIIAFNLTKIYYSEASVLPPKDDLASLGGAGGLGGITTMMRDLSSITKNIGNLGSKNTYNYLVILNSREVAERVINKFNLQEIYHQPSLERTLKVFSRNVVFEIHVEGNLAIGFFDKDPQMACDVANYLVTALNERSYELSMLESQHSRKFLETRIAESMDSLTYAENLLKEYQEKYDIFIIPEQTGAIESGSKIYAEKIAKEIELDYLKSILHPDNSLLTSTRLQLQAINKRINNLPTVGLEYLRLYRDVLIRAKIIEFLRPLLEQTIYQEKRDVPVIVVVDPAKVPEHKAKPKRIIVIGSSVFAWMLITVIYILSIEKWRKFKTDHTDKYKHFKELLK